MCRSTVAVDKVLDDFAPMPCTKFYFPGYPQAFVFFYICPTIIWVYTGVLDIATAFQRVAD